MSDHLFRTFLWLVGGGFAIAFSVIVGPALWQDRDVWGGLMQGFVNPYSTGYSLDAVACWLILAAWVAHERIRHGWIAVVLGAVPGVATGLALYLLLRMRARAA